MNLAVLTYRQTDNLDQLPPDWPAQVIELGDSTDLPKGDWKLMTEKELDALRDANQSDYNVWLASRPAPKPPVLPEYTDKDAAITAGLTKGELFRTGEVVKMIY